MSLSPTSTNPAPTSSAPSPAVMECLGHLAKQRELHPEWFDEYEDAMVDVVADR